MTNIPQIRNLRSILEKYYNKSVVVLSCDAKSLTAPGENYGGVMLAVDANILVGDAPPESKKLVAKLCPANQMLCDIFNIQESFQKEMNMYMSAIPVLVDLEKEYEITDDKIEDMFAKCFGGRISLNPESGIVDKDAVLLFENLKCTGYTMVDRLVGFDEEHAKMILKNLAKFHAGSIAAKILKPELFEKKIKPCLKPIKIGDGFNPAAIDFMIKEVKDILYTNPECNACIDKFVTTMKYNLLGDYRASNRDSLFNGIVHSDYWVNNTMVLYDIKDKPVHNKIVDLQLIMYNSIVHDLLFFLYSSITSSILYPNIDRFIKYYYDIFIERLKKFKIDITPFSWDAFQNEITEVGPFELGHILIMFKPILTERGAIDDMSNFGDDDIFNTTIVGKDFEKRILETALSFIERKWI